MESPVENVLVPGKTAAAPLGATVETGEVIPFDAAVRAAPSIPESAEGLIAVVVRVAGIALIVGIALVALIVIAAEVAETAELIGLVREGAETT